MINNHWVRIVMNRDIKAFFDRLQTNKLDAFEISGTNWSGMGFKSYDSKWFPEFDICEQTTGKTYDVVIADQVFMYVRDPEAAAENVMTMLRPGGVFVITVSFLIRYVPMPVDRWRWSQDGLKIFLEKQNFKDVYTSSWGNRECVIANFGPEEGIETAKDDGWVTYDPEKHSLENDPMFPASVWGFAFKR